MVFGGPGTLPLVCLRRGIKQSMSRLKGKGTASNRLSKTCWQWCLAPVYVQHHLTLNAAVHICTEIDQVAEKAGMQVKFCLLHSPFAWALSQVSARTSVCKRSSSNHPSIPRISDTLLLRCAMTHESSAALMSPPCRVDALSSFARRSVHGFLTSTCSSIERNI